MIYCNLNYLLVSVKDSVLDHGHNTQVLTFVYTCDMYTSLVYLVLDLIHQVAVAVHVLARHQTAHLDTSPMLLAGVLLQSISFTCSYININSNSFQRTNGKEIYNM